MKTDEEYAALQAAFGQVVEQIGGALQKMVNLYESEYDADVPFGRPDWLVSALRSLELTQVQEAEIDWAEAREMLED